MLVFEFFHIVGVLRYALTPSAHIIRWQGTSGAKGFLLNAPPTARGEESRALESAA